MSTAAISQPSLSLADADRIAVLQRAGVLGTPPEEDFDRLARLAQTLTATPIALISFFDENHQYLKSCLGAPEPWSSQREIPMLGSFCLKVVVTGQPLSLEDARQSLEAGTNSVLNDFNIAAYLGIPLISEAGFVLGSLCVIDHQPRHWLPEEQARLEDLAATVSNLVDLRVKSHGDEALRESEERLHLIASATRDVIYDVNLTTGEIWWSRGLMTLLGYRSNEVENTLDWWNERIHPDEKAKVLESFDRALSGNEQFWSKEYQFRRHEGAYIRLFDRGYVIRDNAGQATHFVGSLSDISGYRQAEQAWQESEARLQQLVETTDEGVWLLDRDNHITFVNRRMAEMLGYDREDLVGRSALDFMDAEGQAIITGNLAERRPGAQSHFDFKFRRKDGADLWGLINLGALRTANGTIVGGYVLVSDITERKREAEALQKAYAEIDDLYHNAPCGYHSVAPEGTFLRINDTELAWLGYTREELIGRKSITDIITPESVKLLAQVTSRFQEQGGVRDLEIEMVRKDGTILPVLLSSTIMRDAAGNFVMTRTVIFDRTEHKQTEEALAHERDLLQALMDSIPDTIYFKDTESRFTRINQAQVSFLELGSAEEALGKTDEDFFETPKLAETLLSQEQDMIRSGEPLIDQVEEHLGKDGRVRWMSSSKVPIHDRQGQVVGLVGVSRDITERKQAEIEMQAQKALFENLVAVARATAAMPSLEATLQNALRVSDQLTGAARGSLFLLNDKGEVTHSIRSEGDEIREPRLELVGQVMERGLAGWVAQTRQSALIADTLTDDRWLPSPDLYYRARSALVVPIQHAGSLLGIMTLLHGEPAQFTSDHLKLMEAAADQMALALRNARMLDETQRLAEQMYMLNHISQAALAATTLAELYEALAVRIGELFSSNACQITYWDESRQQAVSKAAYSTSWNPRATPLLSGANAEALTQQVLAQTRALAIEDAHDPTSVGKLVLEAEVKSILGLPLIAHERKLGAAILIFESPRHFTETELGLGERMSRQIALALSNALLYREAAEERGRLQTLIDSSRDGVVMVSLDRRILTCNMPTLRLLELPGQPADWVGKPLRTALLTLARYAPEVLKIGLSEMRRIAQGDEPVSEGEYQIGTQFVRWMNLPVMSDGQPLGRLLVLRDVTEERGLDKMRDDLAHMMVHDLRSPLSSVIGATDLLAKKMALLNDPDQELAEIVRDSSERMLGLVNDILNVSQLESGKMPIEHKPVLVGPLVAEVLQLQNGAIVSKHLRVEAPGTNADLPPVWGDLKLLVRVLQNLVGNAVKFTPAEGRLHIETQVEGPRLKVSIYNSGAGIPPEIRSQLFTKFVRGNQREHGSGLGLAFCSLVVEAHGGHIEAESEPGEGATFTFTLPLYQPSN